MRKRYSLLFNFLVLILLGIGLYFGLPVIFGSTVAPLPDEYQGVIREKAQKYSIDSCLIAAVIRGESNWNPKAGSRAGAQGLMQIVPGTAAAIAARNAIPYTRNQLLDPTVNIELGTAILRYNVDSYGSLRNVLVAYNAGGGRVSLPDNRLPHETQFYIGKISRYYNLYGSLYPEFCTGPAITGGPAPKFNAEDFPEFPQTGSQQDNLDINNFWKFLLTQ
jgi:hypothetical protein